MGIVINLHLVSLVPYSSNGTAVMPWHSPAVYHPCFHFSHQYVTFNVDLLNLDI